MNTTTQINPETRFRHLTLEFSVGNGRLIFKTSELGLHIGMPEDGIPDLVFWSLLPAWLDGPQAPNTPLPQLVALSNWLNRENNLARGTHSTACLSLHLEEGRKLTIHRVNANYSFRISHRTAAQDEEFGPLPPFCLTWACVQRLQEFLDHAFYEDDEVSAWDPPSEPPALEFKTLGSRLVLTPMEGGVEFMVKQPFDELGTTKWINAQEARQLAEWLLKEFPAAE